MRQINTILIQVLLIFCGPSRAWASTSGSVAVNTAYYSSLSSESIEDNYTSGLIDFKSQFKILKNWSLNSSLKAEASPNNGSSIEQFWSEFQELNIQYKKSSTRIKFGAATVNWEGTDLINPMDLVSPKIYFDPLNSIQRSSIGAFYSSSSGSLSVDAAFIPLQSDAKLPGSKSLWWPREFNLPTEADNTLLLLPEHPEYKINGRRTLDDADKNNLALRLSYAGNNFDFAIAGFEGQVQTPLLLPIVNLTVVQVSPKKIFQLGNPIEIQPLYYKIRSGAFLASTTWSNFIFRISAQNIQPLGRDTRIPSWSQLGVFAIERTFDIINRPLTAIIQAVRSREAESEGLSLLSNLTQNASVLGLRYGLSDETTISAAYFQEFVTHSEFQHYELKYLILENFEVKLSADFFNGKKDSALGTYKSNDRTQLQLSYLF